MVIYNKFGLYEFPAMLHQYYCEARVIIMQLQGIIFGHKVIIATCVSINWDGIYLSIVLEHGHSL